MGTIVSFDIDKLIKRIRLLADQRESDYIEDNDIKLLLNGAIASIYFKIVDVDENYFTKNIEVKKFDRELLNDPNSGVTQIPEAYTELDQKRNALKLILPKDFFKIRLLQLNYSGIIKYPFQPISLGSLSNLQSINYGYLDNGEFNYNRNLSYVQMPDHLILVPASVIGDNTLSLYYTPKAPTVDENSETIRLPFGTEEYLVYYVAAFIGDSENLNVLNLKGERERWEKIIFDTISKRDSSFPKKVIDSEDGVIFSSDI